MLDSFELFLGPPVGWKLVALGLTVALGGFLRGVVGFGGALVIVPVLSLVVGPLAAVPIASLSGLPAVFQLLPAVVRHSERRFVGPVACATFIGAPLGTWVLVTLNPEVMKIGIALLVLLMVGMLHQGWQLKGTHLGVLTGAGMLSGVVQGSAGIGGPPAVAVALSRAGSPQQQRANVLAALTAITLSTPLPLWWLGLFTREVLVASLVIMPVYVTFTWLGAYYFTERGARYYRDAALITLALVGAFTLLVAVRDYTTT